MSRSRAKRGQGLDRLEGVVRDVLPGGDSVVTTDAGVVFAVGALPGERVRVVEVRRRGRVLRGRLAAVLEPSPDRVEAPCQLVARCGGCPLMPMARPAQARHLRRLLETAITTPDGVIPVEVIAREAGPRLGYRRRARLAFDASAGTLGYRGRRSHVVTPVDRCPVLEPALEAALPVLAQRWLPLLVGSGQVHLGLSDAGRPVAMAHASEPQAPDAYAAAQQLVDEGAFAGLALAVGEPPAVATWGDPRPGETGLDGEAMVGSAGGFAQANAEVNRALVARAVALAEPDGADVLELYAGHGNLTVPLAARARRLWAVEHSLASVEACRANLRARGLRAEVLAMDAGALPSSSPPRAQVVVLDPPRAGAAEALPPLLARSPERIVYVSCDPRTLGRDLRVLNAGGYRVDAAEAFDMFPHTGHMESLVRLVRA